MEENDAFFPFLRCDELESATGLFRLASFLLFYWGGISLGDAGEGWGCVSFFCFSFLLFRLDGKQLCGSCVLPLLFGLWGH